MVVSSPEEERFKVPEWFDYQTFETGILDIRSRLEIEVNGQFTQVTEDTVTKSTDTYSFQTKTGERITGVYLGDLYSSILNEISSLLVSCIDFETANKTSVSFLSLIKAINQKILTKTKGDFFVNVLDDICTTYTNKKLDHSGQESQPGFRELLISAIESRTIPKGTV